MTNQPRSSYPDPWALARRIAEEWKTAGRDGADRATQVARVKTARARRVAAVSEARIKAAVDRAVRDALAQPEFAESLDQLGPAAAPVPPVPGKPLHEMTAEEWDAHRRMYWQAAMPDHPRTLTIGDLMDVPAGGDEA